MSRRTARQPSRRAGREKVRVEATLTPNALRVLEARYLRRDASGRIVETPAELFERVARAVSEAELVHGNAAGARRWEARFHDMLASLDFLPNSPTLMNAGTPLGQLSACFVLPVDDTMESIFGSLRDMALIERTGGGVGFSFSRLRPAGDRIASTGGTTPGPLSFITIYDCATEHVKRGGRRRGANMAVLRVDHPDIEAFIEAKRDGAALQNFNLSVGATDTFMAAVDAGGDFPLRHPRDGRVVAHRPARPLFDRLCEAAWATGDPGLVFLDTINRSNPTPDLGQIESTNPCGEVPLLPYEACNLGSINLAHLVIEQGDGARVDWERLRGLVHDAVRFLDDVITVNRYPLDAITATTVGNRKLGLGVMGFAELLILLGISYAEERAVRFAGELMAFIAREARAASARLAEERGPFPNWDRSVYAAGQERLRNAARTSIAPTGTISIIAETSSGIEPLFALAYQRQHVLDGGTLVEFNPLLLRYVERRGLPSADVLDAAAHHGRLSSVPGIPDDLRRLFVTALDVPAEQHVRIQAAFQQHVDNAVSKTINLPRDATVAEVAEAYRLAYRLGCKGVTVFRYGSRSTQVLTLGLDEAPYEREHFARCDPGACRL
jgi:ribonucleoside-diphosphate reductase alpha chain